MLLLKQLYKRIFYASKLFRCGVNFGKRSWIGPKAQIDRGKYIYLGEHVRIMEYSRLNCYDKYKKPKIEIGNNVLIGRNVTMFCSDSIKIGNDVMMASYIMITDTNHGIEIGEVPFKEQKNVYKPVVIGNNVWIGEKVCILPGVTIGDNCVIGTASVVTKNIPSNCMAVGNPARVIKKYDFEMNEWVKFDK